MGPSPKTSFIPKQAAGGGVNSVRSRKTFNVLTFISTVVFLSVLILALGVFFYKQYNERRLESYQQELSSLKASFAATGDIDRIRALERKMKIGEYLLDHHISLSRLFDVLELKTQQNASLESFEYEFDPSGFGKLILVGSAGSFNTVALQERGYADEQIFSPDSVIFTGIDTDESAQVSFTVNAELDLNMVSYQVFSPSENSEGTTITTEGPQAEVPVPDIVPTEETPVIDPGTETPPDAPSPTQ